MLPGSRQPWACVPIEESHRWTFRFSSRMCRCVQVLPSVEKQLVWFAGFEIKAYCFARQVSKQMLTDPFDWAVQICTHLIATLKLAQLFPWSCIKFFLLSFGIYTVSAAMWIYLLVVSRKLVHVLHPLALLHNSEIWSINHFFISFSLFQMDASVSTYTMHKALLCPWSLGTSTHYVLAYTPGWLKSLKH